MELLPLVCLCLLSCSGETSAAGDGVKVVVKEDDDAVLPCSLSTKEDITGKLFDWKKDESRKEVFMYDSGIHHNNGITGQDQQFIGQVSHFQDQLKNGNASIKIKNTKMADSGNYSCFFPRLQPRQTFNIELVVGQVLRDRTGENIPGAAPEPNIKILDETKDWSLLQCEAHGDPLPTVEWKDSNNNTLNADTPHVSERGGRSYITVNITVTKTDNYRCVATQEKISHRIATVTYVLMNGAAPEPGLSAGVIVGFVVLSLLLVAAVVGGVGLCINNRKKSVKILVKEGSDAVLPCSLSNKEDITGKTFDWRKDERRQEVFFYKSGLHSDNSNIGQDQQFKGRVSHFQDQLKNGNASIKIIKTKMADSGNYSCIFPHPEPRQTFNIELVVGQVLRDRTGENIPGAAPEPNIKTLADTKDSRLLQCEAHGDPPLTVEWKDSDNNTLDAEERKESKQGRYSYITVKITVTKTDNYSCVATQKEISHQIAAVIPVHIQGAASKPSVTILDQTKDWSLLQCEVLGASPNPKVEWRDSSGNILPVKDLKVTARGDSYDIVLNVTVTKTDRYRCVVTQQEINRQTDAEIYVHMNGLSAGAIAGFVVLSLLLVAAVVGGVVSGLCINHFRKENQKKNEEIRHLRSQPSSATPLTTGSI
ncbi:butyrophilin-like protein 2 [Pagrus major]|uniref:butyrophilin-like protein 2 n=1 Tax=Pagrus major TaxID=143350 RepID=UPI003CC8AAAA